MRVKLMADYACWPLWHDGHGEVGNIDPRSLPLSEELIAALNIWAAKLDNALNWADPGNTEWPDGFFAEFNRQGRELAERLRYELGPSYVVTGRFWGE
jgi:hypothetical protein